MSIVQNVVLGSFVVAVVACVAGVVAADTGTMIPAGEIIFEPIAPGSPVRVAELCGNRSQGEHGMLLKIPAGFEAGLRSHTGDYHALNLQGTWVHTLADGQTKELPGIVRDAARDAEPQRRLRGPERLHPLHLPESKGDFIPAKTQ